MRASLSQIGNPLSDNTTDARRRSRRCLTARRRAGSTSARWPYRSGGRLRMSGLVIRLFPVQRDRRHRPNRVTVPVNQQDYLDTRHRSLA